MTNLIRGMRLPCTAQASCWLAAKQEAFKPDMSPPAADSACHTSLPLALRRR